jgi:hypothetical protein
LKRAYEGISAGLASAPQRGQEDEEEALIELETEEAGEI